MGRNLSDELIGTWQLLERQDRTLTGEPRVDPALGSDPVAILHYDRSGHFAAQFMKRERTGSDASPARASGANNTGARGGYDAYFGTYRVDDARGAVTQELLGALAPENVGLRLTREMRIVGGELVIQLQTTSAAGEAIVRTLRWRRLA